MEKKIEFTMILNQFDETVMNSFPQKLVSVKKSFFGSKIVVQNESTHLETESFNFVKEEGQKDYLKSSVLVDYENPLIKECYKNLKLEEMNNLEAIKTATKNLDEGDHFVYIAKGSDGIIEYVGITNDFVRREAEWASKGRKILPYIEKLDRNSVRIVEQTVIETFGMAKNGGRLTNKINSISTKNPLYEAVKSFKKLIK